jgi:hypothetical protein
MSCTGFVSVTNCTNSPSKEKTLVGSGEKDKNITENKLCLK